MSLFQKIAKLVGGIAVAKGTYAPAFNAGEQAALAVDAVSGRLLVDAGGGNGLTLQASTAQTTTQTLPDQTGTQKGAIVFVNVTSAGSGSITPKIEGKDPVSGTYYTVLTGTAIVANGMQVLRVYPGLPATANVSANDVLPGTFRVTVTANNANSVTYSVAAVPLP